MITIKNLSKKYGEKSIFSNVNLKLPDKGLYLLTGSNGSGKTTFLNLISGSDTNFTGEIIFDNVKLSQRTKHIFNEAIFKRIYQESFYFENKTTLEAVLFPYCNKDVKKAISILKYLDLYDVRDNLASKLSYGENKRLFLAIALYGDPKVLILDELFAALDDDTKKNIYPYIIDISKRILVIISTNQEKVKKHFNPDGFLEIENQNISLREIGLIKNQKYSEQKVTTKTTKVFSIFRNSFKANKIFYFIFILFNLIFSCMMSFSFSISSVEYDAISERIKIEYSLSNYPVLTAYKVTDSGYCSFDSNNNFYVDENANFSMYDDKTNNRIQLSNYVAYFTTFNNTNIELLFGDYPQNENEYILPSYYYDQISNEMINDYKDIKIDFYNDFKVVGIYKSEYSVSEEVLNASGFLKGTFSISYGFLNAFGYYNDQYYTREYFFTQNISADSLLGYNIEVPIFQNDNINETEKLNKTFYYMGLGFLISDILFNISGLIFIYFSDKKQNTIFKLTGISTRKLVISFVVLSITQCVIPLIFSYCIVPLYGLVYSSVSLNYLVGLLPNIAVFPFMSLTPFMFVILSIISFVMIYKFTYNKDVNLLLKKIKK